MYKTLEVEEYEILATLDSRTSEICQGKDGLHYKVDEIAVGVNYPPFHPNCRTTTIKYNPDTEGRTRLAKDKDGKNVKVPFDMKYFQWKNKYINGYNYNRKEKTYDNVYFSIHSDKIYNYLLKSNTEHYKEFKDVGFNEANVDQLLDQLFIGFAKGDRVYDRDNKYLHENFYIRIDLGVENKKNFKTVWGVQRKGDKPKFITAYRNNEKD